LLEDESMDDRAGDFTRSMMGRARKRQKLLSFRAPPAEEETA
jgi:hypothetical protein